MKMAKPITFASVLAKLMADHKPEEGKKGITAYRLAKMAELRHQTIGKFLRGEREPSLESALQIARALGKSLSVFDGVEFEERI